MAVTPYLLYEDVDEALNFLTKAFGMRRTGAQLRGTDGRLNHTAVKCGSSVIMMGRPGRGYRNPKHLGQSTQSLYINVTSVDRHFQRARKAGATILEEPTVTGYGDRRYGVADPEGHQWYFAQVIRRRRPKRKAPRR